MLCIIGFWATVSKMLALENKGFRYFFNDSAVFLILLSYASLETLPLAFSCEFCQIFNKTFFIEHLPTAASETVTENIPGNSARGKKFSPQDEKLQ